MTDTPHTTHKPILSFWPFDGSKPPRKTQLEAFEWLEKLPSDKKYILMEAPVGFGKSNLAITLAGYFAPPFGNSFILTPQKILQKQYEESFEPYLVHSMYGKGNYECHSKNTNCDIGSEIKPQCDFCPYKAAQEDAMRSPNMILNYKLALLKFKYSDKRRFPPRKLMILDECQNLESNLTEFNAVSISELRCKKLKINYYLPRTIERAVEWIQTDYQIAVSNKYAELCRIVDALNDDIEYNPRKLTKDEQQSFRNWKEFGEHLEALSYITQKTLEEIKDRFVLVDEKKSFKFKELYGKTVFHGLVKPMAERFLFMSSTILNKDAFCRDLGIPPEEAAFVSIESEFPEDNRPVIYMPQMKVNYEWNTDKNIENRKDLVVKVKELCEIHNAESGIIHTGNFQIAEWLVSELTDIVNHRVMHHNPSGERKRDDVINEFLDTSETVPTLLISPSITEGLDLKDDLSRFCIIIKTPYPNLGDNWIKRRMEMSKEWYNRQAIIAIIQGGGRVVRSKTDYANTYILDSSFGYLYHQYQQWIPEWWKRAYITL